MKITGTKSVVKFDFENGYVMKAGGEMLLGGKFVVYKSTMNSWEAPHEKEKISNEDIEWIIQNVKNNTNENTVQIIFE